MGINEADTCRKYVLPKLRPWERFPHLITEQYPIDAGRILTTGGRDRRRKKKYADYLQMNLILRGVEYPDIERKNSLATSLNQLGVADQVDVILTNPPFGGEEEKSIKDSFPPDTQTSETALLFLQLIMRLLKRQPTPGRAGVVVPNGTLFGDGVCAKIKEKLLTQYNLHTIVRLPNGVFSPYTSIPTNLLFFDASGPTQEIWYYEVALPEGKKNYSKTKPMVDEDFANCLTWWQNRTEHDRAWKYDFKTLYKQTRAAAQPHWDAAKQAEAIANQHGRQIKELESQIQPLNAELEKAPASQQAKLKKQVHSLKQQQKELQAKEREQRELAKREQGAGDALYWPIYNLDQKNPNAQTDFTHLPPEQLVADIWQKEQRILEILGEIKDVLKTKPSERKESDES